MADDPVIAPVPPTIEKVTKTEETTKTSGDVNAIAQLPPPPVADDRARKWLAVAVIAQFLTLIGFMIYIGKKIDDTQMILGAEIGFVTTVLNYYFGSSSGSAAKSQQLSQK